MKWTTLFNQKFLITDFPVPPQLTEAIGFPVPDNHRLAIWNEDHKVAISNGFYTKLSPCPAWLTYLAHPFVASRLKALIKQGFNLYENTPQTNTEWAFLLDENRLLLGRINLAKHVVNLNPDDRPDWIKTATIYDWNNLEWAKKYGDWQGKQIAKFPRTIQASLEATHEMIVWLNNLD